MMIPFGDEINMSEEWRMSISEVQHSQLVIASTCYKFTFISLLVKIYFSFYTFLAFLSFKNVKTFSGAFSWFLFYFFYFAFTSPTPNLLPPLGWLNYLFYWPIKLSFLHRENVLVGNCYSLKRREGNEKFNRLIWPRFAWTADERTKSYFCSPS